MYGHRRRLVPGRSPRAWTIIRFARMLSNMDRREFFEASAMLTGGAALSRLDRWRATVPRADYPPMICIHAVAVSFVDEGTERVLDNMQRLASINTVFVATFTYGRGIGGRQL